MNPNNIRIRIWSKKQYSLTSARGVCKSHSSTQIMPVIARFSGKIYTAGTNFTRQPVVTVATNLNSA